MAADQKGHPHHLGHVLVVEAVEAEPPQAGGAPGLGNRVGACLGGQGAVEARVKADPLGRSFQDGLQPADQLQGGPVVERGEGNQLAEVPDDGRGQQGGRAVGVAAMHEPMHHQLDAALPGRQLLLDPVGDRPGQLALAQRALVLLEGPLLLIEQAELEAGATGVDSQNHPWRRGHWPLSHAPACPPAAARMDGCHRRCGSRG